MFINIYKHTACIPHILKS